MVVSVMPCTAKKGEILRPDNFTDGRQDTDYVITTTEVIRMIKQMGLKFSELENESADAPFSVASGAGKIFGTTGGVTEAVLRRLVDEKSYNSIREISYTGVRGFEGTKEAVVNVDGRDVKIAVVHGLANAGRLLDKIKAGEVSYDFVEVMACRRGCIMGGGQPGGAGARTRQSRMEGMYKADASSNVRFSEENPAVKQLYDNFLEGKEHKLLHRNLQ
jgi:NADH-quinone oxidoreductase subunit G